MAAAPVGALDDAKPAFTWPQGKRRLREHWSGSREVNQMMGITTSGITTSTTTGTPTANYYNAATTVGTLTS